MIVNYKGKIAKCLEKGIRPKRFPGELIEVSLDKLRILDEAISPMDLNSTSGNYVKKIRGSSKGDTWQLRINEQYRLRFIWFAGNAYNVEIGDFH